MKRKPTGLAGILSLSFVLAACASGGDSGGTAGGGNAVPPGEINPVHTVVDASIAGYTAPEAPGRGTNTDPAIVAGGAGTPSIYDSPDDTTLPLIQTAISFSPSGAEANSGVNAAGASLSYVSAAAGGHSLLTIGGVDDYPLGLTGGNPAGGHVELDGTAGGNVSSLDATLLQWTTYGMWAVTTPDYSSGTIGYFTGGIETPTGVLPGVGTGSYSGTTTGSVINAGDHYALAGDMSMTVDWAAGTIFGSLDNMTAESGAYSGPWNTVLFTGNLAGSGFAGTSSVLNAPGGAASLGIGATGHVAGQLYGPFADEVGGVWTLSDGVSVAAGAFGGN